MKTQIFIAVGLVVTTGLATTFGAASAPAGGERSTTAPPVARVAQVAHEVSSRVSGI
jgi:hypothetical protein